MGRSGGMANTRCNRADPGIAAKARHVSVRPAVALSFASCRHSDAEPFREARSSHARLLARRDQRGLSPRAPEYRCSEPRRAIASFHESKTFAHPRALRRGRPRLERRPLHQTRARDAVVRARQRRRPDPPADLVGATPPTSSRVATCRHEPADRGMECGTTPAATGAFPACRESLHQAVASPSQVSIEVAASSPQAT